MNNVEEQLAFVKEVLTGYYMQKRQVPRYIAGALAETLIEYQLGDLQRSAFEITFPCSDVCIKIKDNGQKK